MTSATASGETACASRSGGGYGRVLGVSMICDATALTRGFDEAMLSTSVSVRHRSGRVQADGQEGEWSSPDSGDLPVIEGGTHTGRLEERAQIAHVCGPCVLAMRIFG